MMSSMETTTHRENHQWRYLARKRSYFCLESRNFLRGGRSEVSFFSYVATQSRSASNLWISQSLLVYEWKGED